jgi:hypothetical protein
VVFVICLVDGRRLESLRQGEWSILIRGRDKVFPLEDVERTLGGLKEVRSARIVTDTDGGILEVHVVASTGRIPKQIARDVESMLVAKLGIQIDHRKISVAQIDDEEAALAEQEDAPREVGDPLGAPVLPSGERRIEFVGVSVAQSHLTAEARVELAMNGLTTVAASIGADSSDSLLRIIAEATIQGVQRFFEDDSMFTVSSVEQVRVGGKPIIAVNICHLAERQEKALVGACPVNGDVPRAAALATLDAVNRFLRRLTLKEPTEYEIGPASES